ncbi:amidohydrolase [Herbiconiux sp. P15]|uniref:amidohydrolase family protein n=1 Tax=Herbiconiux liukaitaii TaxID=3342799 RepID=UPI0035B6B86E
MRPTPLVDAHIHLWDLERMHLSWFSPQLGLPSRVTIGDLGLASGARPSAAVAVQAGDTVNEARWLLDHAATDGHGLVPAVVLQYEASAGWAGVVQPLLEADKGGAPRIAGLRVPTPQGAADLSDIAGLDLLAERLAATGRVLELLIRPEQLTAVGDLASRHPHLTIVVCHLGLGRGEPDGAWRRALESLTAHGSVLAKFSGVHRPVQDDDERLRTIAATAFAALGPDRLLFGSDWPMSRRVAPYDEIVARTAAALPRLDAEESVAFWAGTATRAYGV